MNIFIASLYLTAIVLVPSGNLLKLDHELGSSKLNQVNPTSTTDQEYETTVEVIPWPVSFEIDIKGDGDPWRHSGTSEDPITVNWFSYFSSWIPADMNHVAEYFLNHGINTVSLKNTTSTGFWTSFSNQNCYLIPDIETTTFTEDTTTSEPEPPIDCHDTEYPHFAFEIKDPSRYILETLEITYALHPNSSIVITENGTEIDTIEFKGDEKAPPVWNVLTYNFTIDQEYTTIQIDLVISSDDLDSGEFILIDNIVVTALDTYGEPTTPPKPETTKVKPITDEITPSVPSVTSTLAPGPQDSASAPLVISLSAVGLCLLLILL